jgi:hypothetical protein
MSEKNLSLSQKREPRLCPRCKADQCSHGRCTDWTRALARHDMLVFAQHNKLVVAQACDPPEPKLEGK